MSGLNVWILLLATAMIGQNAAYEISFLNILDSQMGLGWPRDMSVLNGEEMLLKLSKSLANHDSCVITMPNGEHFEAANPPSDKYEKWDDCGVRVRHVNASTDEGRWKITVHRAYDNNNITGFVEVNVLNQYQDAVPEHLTLEDGVKNEHVILTSLPSSYCMLTQPYSQASLVPGLCEVNVDVTRAVRGTWEIAMGLPGTVNEKILTKDIAVFNENLQAGFTNTNDGKLNLFCNLVNTHKNVSFCRFQKVSSSSGYNVRNGLSDGQHSYYGKGFEHQECGLTVEHPTAADFVAWRCSVGVYEMIDGVITDRTPIQALINPSQSNNQATKTKRIHSKMTQTTVVVERHTPMTLKCSADVALAYCWFRDTLGNTYTPLEQTSEEQEFWSPADNKSLGECAITFRDVNDTFTGTWSCNMGASSQLGIELTDTIQVRVTGPLAADSNDIVTNLGDQVNLYCHSASGRRALNYCRFLSPKLVGINVDDSVTVEQSILGKYYYTPDKHLDFGDCALTIISVSDEDLGEWTCASTLSGDIAEASDTVVIRLNESVSQQQTTSRRFRAGIASGIVVGMAALCLILVITIWTKNKRSRPSTSSQIQLEQVDDNQSYTSDTSSQSGVGARNMP